VVTGTASPVEVLKRAKTVAVVGASKTPDKEAFTVPQYLKEHGYEIIPINPTATEIHGEKAYPSLLDLPEEVAKAVDVVEVFRPSAELPEVARQAAELKKRYGKSFVFWAQQGLENEEAKRILDENKIAYVMDACMRALHKIYVR
jgi:predicted CoA-binding protein